MKKLALFIFLIASISLRSQNIDSLIRLLPTIQDNEKKLDLFYKSFSKKMRKSSQKKIIHVLDSFSVSMKSEKDKANALFKMGTLQNSMREFNEALITLFKSLQLFEKNKDLPKVAKIHMEMGKSFYELKNSRSAIDHFYTSLKLNEIVKDKKMIAGCHVFLGNIFKDETLIDSSLIHHRISLDLSIELKDSSGIASAYNDIGLSYKKDKKNELALEYLIKALKIRELTKNARGIAGSNINIGNALKHLKRNKEAVPYFNKGIELAKQSGNNDFYLNGIIGRAKNAKLMQDYKQSAEDFGDYVEMKDSLYKQEMNQTLSELEVTYQSEKKDAEILIQQEQIKTKTEQNSKQKILIVASGIALLMALIAIIVVYRSYKQNKRNAKVLVAKNHVIEEKNKEITDSINYAKLIQQSLLASKDMLDKNLESYFIIYKPKDIVSGDFYWASETPKGFLVACVDCTGHGVPGAFMSLIGKENLDKALAKTVNPGEILHELNINVKRSLNQNNTSGNKDGMDAAILRIERDKNGNAKVAYAGANRPLYILKNDLSSVEEIKATKQAVGGFTSNEQVFEEHIINVNKGDTLIITTDGYADQFGSESNKKLTTKRFKDLLVSVKAKTADEQMKTLNDFFTVWKGNREQLDDLLVIGINV
ncbi:MAG: SpoIIE family protein phosphatase [Sphingobacteriaceae bacterium]|nr:SpoIIE family protein phosphatase [Sphingobacteriaceae bacterium]